MFMCALSCACASAQDSLKVTTLKTVVVSATRSEQPVIDVPRSVTVIPAEVIGKSVYQSLGDLLNAETGLYVTGAMQTPGTNQNVFMRGSNSNQVAVMIDGVRVNDSSSPNAAIDLSEISLANVERVEIIRGSHSTMFGGAAVGGVINIITRKGRDGFHDLTSWQGGTFGKHTSSSVENANLVYGFDNGLYLSGSLFQEDVNGLDASAKAKTSTSFTSDRDDFHKTDANLKAGFRNEVWDAYLSFKNVHQHTDIDNGAYSDDDNNYLVFDRRFFQYRFDRGLGRRWRASILGSFSDSERFYENDSSKLNPTTYDRIYSTGSYYGKVQTHEVQLNYEQKRMKAVLGGGLYREKMFFDTYLFINDSSFPYEAETNYDSINARTYTGYLFGQASYRLGKFDVSAGTRLNHHSTAGNFVTFEASPSLTFGDLLLFASVSSGFNAPSLYQLYDPSKGFTAYTTRGNLDLRPETSLSIEAGAKKEFPSGSYATLSAYQTTVNHAIEYVYLWNGATPVAQLSYSDDRGDTYINAGRNIVQGVEAEGFARITKSIFLKANVSFLSASVSVNPADIELEKTGGNHVQLYNLGTFLEGDIEQKHLARRPDFTAFGRVSFRPVPTVTASAAYRYTGKRFDSGYDSHLGPYGALSRLNVRAYQLVDFDLSWQASDMLSVAFKVENVLNEAYRELAGFETRGRSAYLKVTAKW